MAGVKPHEPFPRSPLSTTLYFDNIKLYRDELRNYRPNRFIQLLNEQYNLCIFL